VKPVLSLKDMEYKIITEMDPKVISAIIGAIAVFLSAVISYFIAKKVEQRKSTLEYLRNKITLLEEKKKALSSLTRAKNKGKLTKDNFAAKAAAAIANMYDVSVEIFSDVDHYLCASSVKQIRDRILLMSKSLAKARGEHILEESFKDADTSCILHGNEIISEMGSIPNSILKLVDDELVTSVKRMEKLSGLQK
jgi:translation initiation factor 6 (eIF-6)